MSDITWQFQAAIPAGPAFTINQPTLQVDAYDVASVKGPATTNNIAVPIQPGTGAGDVVFLVVSSSLYDPGINNTVAKDTQSLAARFRRQECAARSEIMQLLERRKLTLRRK